MIITLSPMRSDQHLTLVRHGDTLTLNDTTLDFSSLSEGGTLALEDAGSPWIVSDVRRTNGQIALTLILPHGSEAPAQTLFPAPLHVTTDGPVALPPFDAQDKAI